ncbi:uncharacterized protein Ecym_4089 [Eremothecium cymbalariae DBVPG|uniref:YMC020W-like alpha/beta hydrolase domain-containing protein n=1 Tax=Eremothecium cymbalariae (strain CBS 270.75 / DBVPG 7215 / KCTC 17166 / NRRL Y-17582) TaxID=931890 RepID=G8JT15_ERECY|nr:hypothetical protein Ecym_4089 [Eremothecium cymbalariae DBVPG\
MTSSRSSNKSVTTSLGNKNSNNKSNGTDTAVEPVDEGEVEHLPLNSWRVWYRKRRPSMNTSSSKNMNTMLEKLVEQEQGSTGSNKHSSTSNGNNTSYSSWWRKGSYTSLKGLDRRYSDTSNGTTPDSFVESAFQGQQTPSSPEDAINKESSRGKKRSWPLWNKNSPPIEDDADFPHQSKSKKPVINELILSTRKGAILFKPKSAKEIAQEDKSSTSQHETSDSAHLLVPSFDILPKHTPFTFLYSSVGRLGHKWNLINESRLKNCTLYRRGPQTTLNMLSANKSKPVKVLLVGVHGFFPTKMIRPLIGEPTGTSTKFITEAEKTVVRWFREKNASVQISKIALEKEGKVFERVGYFFEVMKKWANEINDADFVYFVAHSQGCPVTVILLAKLIEAGVINLNPIYIDPDAPVDLAETKRKKVISVLAMAGINNGPFYGVDQTFLVKAYSTIENDSLQELFQFQDFNTIQSKKYIQSLRIIIASNVKITYIGSINDQLVPLYSSTCLFAHHPNIFRATFIDKDSKTPAFITRIVKIAHHLINLGYDDHNIIKEISASLAGNLTCGGHSKIYNEDQVYELGIKFALETTDLPVDIPVIYKPYQVNQLGSNPYHLPWCMRGLLYECGAHLNKEEILMLFKEFDRWEPETKQLKDVKYRLSGLKSKL